MALGAAQILAAPRAATPRVTKVEPPSWWVGSSLNPLRLLLHGEGLQGVHLEPAAGLSVGEAQVNAGGTSALVDLTLAPDAAPGMRTLRLRSPAGMTTLSFEVRPPLARDGRFQGFSRDDLLYLVMPDRFANGDPANDDPAVSKGLLDRRKGRYYHGGDLQGLIDHLPYLKDLGVTALWLTPVYDNVNHLNQRETYDGQAITDYHGYGAVDFYAVEEHLGTLETLRQLVAAAHGLGLKVIQDQVANHTGPYHPWVQDPPTPRWYHGSAAQHLNETWQIWTLMDPYATPETRRPTLDGWFVDILPDLNQDDPEVARYLIQNAVWWVGVAGFDGIRQDTLPYVPRAFWHDWSAALKREFPRLRLVGEMWDGDPALVSYFQGGVVRDGVDSGLDALFDFPLLYPVRHAFAEGKPLKEVPQVLGHDGLYRDPTQLVTFLGLHDTARFMNEPGADLAGLKLAQTLLLTTRGIPMVYYGDEIALLGGNDPDNRRDFPGGWKEDARNAFMASGRSADEQGVFEHVRRLAHLRQELPALRRGRLVNLAAGEQTYAYARVGEGASVILAFNNGKEAASFDLEGRAADLAEGVSLEDRLGTLGPAVVAEGRLRLRVPARTAALLVPKIP